MPFIKTRDGIELYVKDMGSGRPVVLLHGWPLNADSWDEQAVALAEAGHRVIAYDRRGFGRSSQPISGYDYDTLSDDLADVIEATGADDVTLVGFSMGGGEVARYLSRHGGKGIVKAGLISSVLPYLLKDESNPDGVDQSVFDDQMKAPIAKDRAAFMASFAGQFYGVGYITSPVSQQVVQHFWTMAMQASPKATLACIDAFGKTDFRPDLASFRVPTLVIHGTGDKTVPIDITARIAAARIAGAQAIEYDGAPHGLTVTHKDQLSADLVAFAGS